MIIFQCDLCDKSASVEVSIAVKTVSGTPCRSTSKHLCPDHLKLVRDFETVLAARTIEKPTEGSSK